MINALFIYYRWIAATLPRVIFRVFAEIDYATPCNNGETNK